MTQLPFRVFFGDDGAPENQPHQRRDENPCRLPSPGESDGVVRVALKDLVATLTDASQKRLAWLEDFAEEELRISADLYEVILAYQAICRAA
ncbi:MAG: hypothetical protein KDB14_13505 [Planctomycetales bacterium]|nr:hypothetical protein [Planctomycetales bacterium]